MSAVSSGGGDDDVDEAKRWTRGVTSCALALPECVGLGESSRAVATIGVRTNDIVDNHNDEDDDEDVTNDDHSDARGVQNNDTSFYDRQLNALPMFVMFKLRSITQWRERLRHTFSLCLQFSKLLTTSTTTSSTTTTTTTTTTNVKQTNQIQSTPSIGVERSGLDVVFRYEPRAERRCAARLVDRLNEQLLIDLSSSVVAPLALSLRRQRTAMWFRPMLARQLDSISSESMHNFVRLLSVATSLIDDTLRYAAVVYYSRACDMIFAHSTTTLALSIVCDRDRGA
jgi:hypothetical protein